jgi:hypothetical protein
VRVTLEHVMLAAIAADEAVRRGSSVWRAFVIALLGTSALNVVAQSLIFAVLGMGPSSRGSLTRTARQLSRCRVAAANVMAPVPWAEESNGAAGDM